MHDSTPCQRLLLRHWVESLSFIERSPQSVERSFVDLGGPCHGSRVPCFYWHTGLPACSMAAFWIVGRNGRHGGGALLRGTKTSQVHTRRRQLKGYWRHFLPHSRERNIAYCVQLCFGETESLQWIEGMAFRMPSITEPFCATHFDPLGTHWDLLCCYLWLLFETCALHDLTTDHNSVFEQWNVFKCN